MVSVPQVITVHAGLFLVILRVVLATARLVERVWVEKAAQLELRFLFRVLGDIIVYLEPFRVNAHLDTIVLRVYQRILR